MARRAQENAENAAEAAGAEVSRSRHAEAEAHAVSERVMEEARLAQRVAEAAKDDAEEARRSAKGAWRVADEMRDEADGAKTEAYDARTEAMDAVRRASAESHAALTAEDRANLTIKKAAGLCAKVLRASTPLRSERRVREWTSLADASERRATEQKVWSETT